MRCGQWLQLGTQASRVELGILNTVGEPTLVARNKSSLAENAPRYFGPSTFQAREQTARGSAQRHVQQELADVKVDNWSRKSAHLVDQTIKVAPVEPLAHVSALRISDGQELAAVYNLSVEGQPEFFANGILVHNCDAFADALNDLALTPIQTTTITSLRI